MKEDDAKTQDTTLKTSPRTPRHHGRTRRALLKELAIGGAVVAGASQALPKKWTKPVIDSVVLPVHAQATSLGTIAPNWVLGDDAPGSLGGIGAGTTNASDFLYDDGTDMAFTATLSPASGATVTITTDVSGTTYGGDDFGTTSAPASTDSGVATFGTFSPPNDDFGDTPGTGTITVTFSAPGYASSVITLNLT